MAKRSRQPPVPSQTDASIEQLGAVYSSFDPAHIGTGTSQVNLSNNNLTATAAATASQYGIAATTPGDNSLVYFEVTNTSALIGLMNVSQPVNNAEPGGTVNSIGITGSNGEVFINNAVIGSTPGPTFSSTDWVGVAVNFPAQTIQWRNITQNSAWSPTFSFASITPTPFLACVGFTAASASSTVNFDGTFLGTPPSGAYGRWHTAPTGPSTAPRDTFSEQPATVITVDAIIANGNYTATGPTDRVLLPFSIVQFGAATLDTNNNLQFQDVVIDDPPLLAITLQVAGPATVTIYGQWDYSGTWFVITTVNIPTSTAVSISNVPILPPNYPQFGQGDILELSLTCSTTATFTWTSGHVYGIETVQTWPPVEGSPIPPSITGRSYTITGGTVTANFPAYTPLFPPPLVGQGGGAAPTFPPPTPPPIGQIPVGVLVGPAIAAAAVPPSLAGKALIIYAFGSATAPPASAAFPEQTTTYPSPPIVFSNIYTGGSPPTTPPSTASTPPMGGSYNTGGQWGPPIGPALPPVVPTGTRPFMAEANKEVDAEAGSTYTPAPHNSHSSDEPTHPRGRGRRRHV